MEWKLLIGIALFEEVLIWDSEICTKKVGLVLNLVNGYITLEFHILFDDMLYTVMSSTDEYP